MYYTKIKKTQAQLEIMLSALEMEYNAKTDDEKVILMAHYFEVSEEDARESYNAYKASLNEDFEQQSKRIEYARV